MKKLFIGLLMILGISATAQFSSASLQASGLTCSICSKAVKNALEGVSFIDKVQVDIKNQQYNLSFKEGMPPDFDALSKAVTDAGFSVASLKVMASISDLPLGKDGHVEIGHHWFHFLNSGGQKLTGNVSFSLVDKAFVSAKDFKKYAAMTKLPCVQTGRMAKCCAKEGAIEPTRIYHAVI